MYHYLHIARKTCQAYNITKVFYTLVVNKARKSVCGMCILKMKKYMIILYLLNHKQLSC